MSASRDLQPVTSTDANTIALAGCSKNAGKTTAMNALLSAWKDRPTGILSIGIDGEDADFWLGVPKPRIEVAPGTLFATGHRTLHCTSRPVDVIEETGIVTPLGELVVARATTGGKVLLAGVRHKEDVRLVRDRLFSLGAHKILIDGAWQRLMSADPEISDALVLATGAILGKTVDVIVEKTAWFVNRLTLPEVDSPDLRALQKKATAENRTTALSSGGDIVSAEGVGTGPALELARRLGSSMTAIVLSGALPAGFADKLVEIRRSVCDSGDHGVALIVSDATRVFSGQTEFSRFHRAGHRILVGRAIRLLALAVNPVSVTGHSVSSDEISTALESRFPGIPAIDFVLASEK